MVGPADIIEAGAYVAMARNSGIALKVFDATGNCRGVFGGWPATRSAVFDLVAEWEASID